MPDYGKLKKDVDAIKTGAKDYSASPFKNNQAARADRSAPQGSASTTTKLDTMTKLYKQGEKKLSQMSGKGREAQIKSQQHMGEAMKRQEGGTQRLQDIRGRAGVKDDGKTGVTIKEGAGMSGRTESAYKKESQKQASASVKGRVKKRQQ